MKNKYLASALVLGMLFLWSSSANCESLLQEGTVEWGFSAGFGDNFHYGGDVVEDVEFFFINPFLGIIKKKWDEHGSLELACEGFLSHVQQEDEDRYAIGVTPFIVYNFEGSGKIIPFLEVGAGILFTDIDCKGFGSSFDFTPQVGFGIRYFIQENTFLKFSYRIHHISNGNLDPENVGINSNFYSLGITFLR